MHFSPLNYDECKYFYNPQEQNKNVKYSNCQLLYLLSYSVQVIIKITKNVEHKPTHEEHGFRRMKIIENRAVL